MMQKITEAIDGAYDIGDMLMFLLEWPSENVALEGKPPSENHRILEALRRIGGIAPTVERRSAVCSTETPSFAARSFNALHGDDSLDKGEQTMAKPVIAVI